MRGKRGRIVKQIEKITDMKITVNIMFKRFRTVTKEMYNQPGMSFFLDDKQNIKSNYEGSQTPGKLQGRKPTETKRKTSDASIKKHLHTHTHTPTRSCSA